MRAVKELFISKVHYLSRRADAITKMKPEHEKGYFREHFIHEIMEEMLPFHLGVGSGIIVAKTKKDSEERKTSQCDVIIYDKRILPPFIVNTKNSIFPFQSVIAIFEIKTGIRNEGEWNGICGKMENIANFFKESQDELEWYDKDNKRQTIPRTYKPRLLVFSYGKRMDSGDVLNDWEDLYNPKTADNLIPEFIQGYCLMGKGSNIRFKESPGFVPSEKDNEMERFFCTTIDNIIREAEKRYEELMFESPRMVLQTDIWGKYIRK
jgi:hypothetical protein